MHKNLGKLMLRPRMHALLLEEVARQGISLRYGCKVVRYFEEDSHGGVELQNGEIIVADVLIAADGAHSPSWKVVSPENVEAWEPKEHDEFRYLIAHGAHAIVLSSKETIAFVLVHAVSVNPYLSSTSLSAPRILKILLQSPGPLDLTQSTFSNFSTRLET